MVDSILSLLYDSTVLTKWGGGYVHTIYSWSAFALVIWFVCLTGFALYASEVGLGGGLSDRNFFFSFTSLFLFSFTADIAIDSYLAALLFLCNPFL